MGFRALMDVIPLDATLVRGSHGVTPRETSAGPMIATNAPSLLDDGMIEPTDVSALILKHLSSDQP
jgi:hypothetical protein